MKTMVLGLLAETPVHAGTGRSAGVIDLPVAREAATDYPVLVGSSLKGALRDHVERRQADNVSKLFGEPDQAGGLMVSDGRILLLPVRSLAGAYRWVTCPHVLERFQRDLRRARRTAAWQVPAVKQPRTCLAAGSGQLFLEERQFTISGPVPDEVSAALEALIPHEQTRARVGRQLVVLHDDDFAWFARYGLAVQARNVLEDGTKKSKNLWYEESLPPDSLMYALITGRNGAELDTLRSLFANGGAYLQAGGNETVGHGWFAVQVIDGSAGADS